MRWPPPPEGMCAVLFPFKKEKSGRTFTTIAP